MYLFQRRAAVVRREDDEWNDGKNDEDGENRGKVIFTFTQASRLSSTVTFTSTATTPVLSPANMISHISSSLASEATSSVSTNSFSSPRISVATPESTLLSSPEPEISTSDPSSTLSPTPAVPRTTAIIFGVVGAGASLAILFAIGLYVWKRLRRRKSNADWRTTFTTQDTQPAMREEFQPPPPTAAQRSWSIGSQNILGVSSGYGSISADEIPPPPAPAVANNAIERHERLGLVRNDLLRPREREGVLGRSQLRRGTVGK